MAPIPFAYGLRRGASRPPFSSSLVREVRVDGRWNKWRQGTSTPSPPPPPPPASPTHTHPCSVAIPSVSSLALLSSP